MTPPDSASETAVVSVPDIRDYEKINAELVQRLDSGAKLVCLAGAEGQRFLAAGLKGAWNAVVEVEGRAGPELAAEMDAPGLTIVCRGPAADGAGRGLRAGRILILGDAGEGLAYAQQGGTVLATGGTGARAGLNQRGGVLAMLGPIGRLAGERQVGGLIFAFRDQLGPHAGRGRRGGRLLPLISETVGADSVEVGDLAIFRAVLLDFSRWTGWEPDDRP
ncbi:GXGXG motif-containing protein [Singulisphaera sp. GP187]|uniref:GltB/FmdC/FwdC-like GXGXG domain-containing protein n=1 Tax=Singulisphaera sp. GP187 TaxID=1882752 RepID=UPI00092B1ABA|nr:glutamate synthase [Singulisphaera sp. GP187]SIO03240.1 GXGXG motif-containing protein [Singulisphaera sp. GP187]